MEKFNISVPKKYTKDGVEKSSWKSVGSLLRFPASNGKDESFMLELNMFPDTKFGVFKEEAKTNEASTETPIDESGVPF